MVGVGTFVPGLSCPFTGRLEDFCSLVGTSAGALGGAAAIKSDSRIARCHLFLRLFPVDLEVTNVRPSFTRLVIPQERPPGDGKRSSVALAVRGFYLVLDLLVHGH
jgi:hypothetical protein